MEVWPPNLPFSSQAWMKAGPSRTGGRSISGSEQVVRSDAGYWAMRARVIVPFSGVRGEERTLAYRGLYAAVDGMAGEILVPCVARWRPYDVHGRMLSAAAAATFADGGGLMDHSGFGQTEVVYMRAGADAALGATRITVLHTDVPPLRPGHYFGLGDRLYLVARAWANPSVHGVIAFGGAPITFGGEPLNFGSVTYSETIEFWPKLRAPLAAGEPLILGRPVCRMRMAADETGVFDQINLNSADVSIDFAEVW